MKKAVLCAFACALIASVLAVFPKAVFFSEGDIKNRELLIEPDENEVIGNLREDDERAREDDGEDRTRTVVMDKSGYIRIAAVPFALCACVSGLIYAALYLCDRIKERKNINGE